MDLFPFQRSGFEFVVSVLAIIEVVQDGEKGGRGKRSVDHAVIGSGLIGILRVTSAAAKTSPKPLPPACHRSIVLFPKHNQTKHLQK